VEVSGLWQYLKEVVERGALGGGRLGSALREGGGYAGYVRVFDAVGTDNPGGRRDARVALGSQTRRLIRAHGS